MDDLPEEGVTKRDVRVVRHAGRHEDPSIDDLAERGSHDGRREFAHGDEQLVVDPRPGGRRDTQDLLPRVRDGRDAGEHDIAKPRRNGVAPGLARSRDHLLGVERIPVGPLQRPVDRPASGSCPSSSASKPRHLVPIEPREVDPVDALVALELGQEGQEGATRVDLVGPDGGDEEHPLVAQVSREERQQVPRRAVGPLKVLDHEDDRGHRAIRSKTPRTARTGEPERIAHPTAHRTPRHARGKPRVLTGGSRSDLWHEPGQLGAAWTRAVRAGHPGRRRGTTFGTLRRTGRTGARPSRVGGSRRSGPGRRDSLTPWRTSRPGVSCRSQPRPRRRRSSTRRSSPARRPGRGARVLPHAR